jgi:hypothetical protein
VTGRRSDQTELRLQRKLLFVSTEAVI